MSGSQASATRWWPRVAAFLVIFGVLQLAYAATPGQALQRWVIDELTVRPAAAVIAQLWPQAQPWADGPRIRALGGGLNVLQGCEGLDVAMLLVAAMLVAPVTWRARLTGLAWALPLVWLANQVRVVALFHAYREDRAWFQLLHGSLAPLALVLLVGLVFSHWVARQPPAAAARSGGLEGL